LSATRSRIDTTSAGHATLVAELRDSVTKTSAARTALGKWARVLRKGPDDATARAN
jgi:hypothetical protein